MATLPLLPDAYTTPPIRDDAATGVGSDAAAKPLGFFDRVKLGWKQAGAQADWGLNEHRYESSAYQEIRGALDAKGYQLPAAGLLNPDPTADFYSAGYHPSRPWLSSPGAKARFDAFWTAFADARSRDPNFLPAYKDVHDFGTLIDHVHGQQNAALADVANQAPDGLGGAGLIGGFGHGFTDPISYIPLVGPEAKGLSFGSRLLYQGLRFGAINAGVTVGTEPLVEHNAAQLGQQRTAGDFISDLLSSAGTGAVLGVGSEFLRLTPSAIREGSFAAAPRRFEADAFGRAVNNVVKRTDLPEGSPLRSFDLNVAHVFSEVVPPDKRTPDEQAAIHAVERDAEVKATSPFVAGPEGDDQHNQWLDQAMHAITSDAPSARGNAQPMARETIAAADSPNEAATGTRMPAREILKAKIHGAEGDGRNALGGAALGPYQFEPRTWVSLFKRRYPNDPRSFDEIAALRTNPQLNDVLINDLIGENAMRLRHAGFDENAGNLYLAHVLGADKAVAVLRADPGARLGDLLPRDYFPKNPFKTDDSAGSLIHWAYGKMGETGFPEHVANADSAAGAQGIAAAEAAPDVEQSTGRFDVEAMFGDVGMNDRPVLNPDLFDTPEEHAAAQLRFERARDASDGFAPVMSRAEAFSPAEHFGALRGYTGKVTTEAIGETLGISPEEAQRSVQAMMAIDRNSPFVLARERNAPADAPATRVMRRPRPPQNDKPETLVQYIKRIGGIDAAGAGEIVHMSGGVDQVGKLADVRVHAARQALSNARYSKAPRALREHQIIAAQRRLDEAQRAVKSDPRGVGLDTALNAAIESGFFPELGTSAYDRKPDNSPLLDAIDAELRGKAPRHRITDAQALAEAEAEAQRERYGDQPAETPLDRAERLYQRIGHNHEAVMEAAHRSDVTVTDDMAIDASDLIDAGYEPDAAMAHAIVAQSYRDLEEIGYELDHEGQRFADAAGLPEPRGGEFADPGDEPGGGRSFADAGAEAESRAEFAQSAHDPKAGKFADPIGVAAEAQADTFVHDLEMTAATDAGKTAYRLDEEGGESDLASILDEIEEAQKAAAEMRGCIKPKGGE